MTVDYSMFEENDDFELDAGFGEGGLDSSPTVNKPCKCHVEITDATRVIKPDKVPQHKIDMRVVASTDPTQVGKMHYHHINLAKGKYEDGKLVGLEDLTPGARKSLFRFFRGFGLLTTEEIEGSAKVKLPFNRLLGAQAIIAIEEDKYTDKDGKEKKSYRIPWGDKVYQFDDEEAKGVPTDPETRALLLAGGGVGNIDDI